MAALALENAPPKTILVPSGDQEGSNCSWRSSGIISRGVSPLIETVYNLAFWPGEKPKKTMSLPLGDQQGCWA